MANLSSCRLHLSESRFGLFAVISLDHQIIDGADAEEFLAYIGEQLETGQFAI